MARGGRVPLKITLPSPYVSPDLIRPTVMPLEALWWMEDGKFDITKPDNLLKRLSMQALISVVTKLLL